MIDKVDCDVEGLFSTEKHNSDGQSNGTTAPSTPTTTKIPETIVIKKKADKAETEQFYLSVRPILFDLTLGNITMLFSLTEISRLYTEFQPHHSSTSQAETDQGGGRHRGPEQ